MNRILMHEHISMVEAKAVVNMPRGVKDFLAYPVGNYSKITPLKNRILASLTVADQNIVFPLLNRVKLVGGTTLMDAGEKFSEIIFPTTSLVSLQFDSEDGRSIEVGAIGNEGLIGVPYVMGRDTTTLGIYISYTGYGYRIKSTVLKGLLETVPALKSQILLYAQVLFSQICINGACNRLHSIDQQFAKMLLHSADGVESNNLLFSQESMSFRMGVRRESVTESARRLKALGVVDYSRGKFTILNREKLEQKTCECYFMISEQQHMLDSQR